MSVRPDAAEVNDATIHSAQGYAWCVDSLGEAMSLRRRTRTVLREVRLHVSQQLRLLLEQLLLHALRVLDAPRRLCRGGSNWSDFGRFCSKVDQKSPPVDHSTSRSALWGAKNTGGRVRRVLLGPRGRRRGRRLRGQRRPVGQQVLAVVLEEGLDLRW